MNGTMCPCPDDFNCASCLGLASPMDGTDKMKVEFVDENKQRENTHLEVSIEVMTRLGWRRGPICQIRWNRSHNFSI